MRTSIRLITTFDEVPRLDRARARTEGVDLKRKTAEVSSGHLACSRKLCGPQGLRRPRFSFFRFTFQTAQGRNTALPLNKEGTDAWAPDRDQEPSHPK